jgi:DNA-binding protein YbaB
MFDILGKLGDIKGKAENAKNEIINKKIEYSDSSNYIQITLNGKKDILNIQISDSFNELSKDDKQNVLLISLQEALKESEKFTIDQFKSVVPNIPGFNLF